MAEYPPTPPFGMAPSQVAPPYRGESHHNIYEYGDSKQPGQSSLLEYRKAQTRAAYEQNAQVTDFNVGTMASGMPPLPVYRDQESHSYGYLNGSYGHDGPLDPPQSHDPYNVSLNSFPHELPKITPNQLIQKHPLSHATATPNAEEGEVSEGEFEEVRLGVNRIPEGMASMQDHYGRQYEDRHRPSYHGTYNGDGQHGEIPDPSLTDIYGRSLDLSRGRSDSYSPYEPPNESEYEPYLAQEILAPRRRLSYHQEHEPPEEHPRAQRVRQSEHRSDLSHVDRSDPPRHSYRSKRTTMAHADLETNSDSLGPNFTAKSLHDARREAQNAILNLLPLKVRYHDYIDEGIDEDIVRRQFESLRVPLPPDMSPIKTFRDSTTESLSIQGLTAASRNIEQRDTFASSSPQALSVNQSHVDRNTSIRDNFSFQKNASSNITKSNDTDHTVDHDSAVESRKHRIARLLAEKKKKQPSPAGQADSPVHVTSLENSILNKANHNSQTTAKADKERLLRQKMEALQKSREQRAQKNAAKTATIESIISGDASEDSSQKPNNKSTSGDQASDLSLPKSTSPVSTLSKQAMPSIPGLFLASGPSAPQGPVNHIIASDNVQNGILRRRPVASDFDKSSSTTHSHKRPFGQNRMDQPLVIDVSDDESDETNNSEIAVEQSQAVIPSSYTLTGGGIAKVKAIRDLPPLSDLPPRKPFPTTSAMSTLSATQPSKMPINKPEDLQRKELEIQLMKRKIAEAERRKRAKQNSSGSQTPRLNDVTSSPAQNNGVSIADKVETSIQIEHLIDDASRQVAQDQLKLVEAHAEERVKTDELKRTESERRRLRRAEIASNLPVVDAEVEEAQKQLANLRAEMARIEAAVQKGLEDKRRLAEEMDKLGQEADEQLQAQIDKLDELKSEQAREDKVSEPADQGDLMNETSTPALAEKDMDASMSDGLPISNTELQQTATSDIVKAVPEVQAALSFSQAEAISGETQHEECGPPSPELNKGNDQNESLEDMAPEQALEDVPQNATPETNDQFQTDSTGDIEMADSFAPNPEFLAPASTTNSADDTQLDDSPSHTNEEPMDVVGGESDQYEPPEATPQPADAFSLSGSPPFSPAPPAAISGSSRIDKEYDDISLGPDEVTTSNATRYVDKFMVPLAQANQDGSVLPSRKTFFTPYESPLKHFRAFRFHSTFQQEVPGGFKSITYSNNIKDDKELCRYELAGGVCNDTSCEFQHFRDMGLADDAILVELGNSAGYSEEDKPRFVAGLRTVLQGLRAKKTKDFHVIASEIAAYRARFLGDKSSILLLGESPA